MILFFWSSCWVKALWSVHLHADILNECLFPEECSGSQTVSGSQLQGVIAAATPLLASAVTAAQSGRELLLFGQTHFTTNDSDSLAWKFKGGFCLITSGNSATKHQQSDYQTYVMYSERRTQVKAYIKNTHHSLQTDILVQL